MATGTACRLYRANFKKIFMLEIKKPLAVRRKVCFCEAIHDGHAAVEGIEAKNAEDCDQFRSAWKKGIIPVIADPEWKSIETIHPHVVIDAMIAKKNLGTAMSEAGLVIGLGPGFEAGKDVHVAIETNRGHNLGRLIFKGCPEPDTGIPGNIGGYTAERVLRAPCRGIFMSDIEIGTAVKKNDITGYVGKTPVTAGIDGVIRGQIRPGTSVTENMKIGDIDPRGKKEYCTTISEKARAIGGSVLEAVLNRFNV